jgi:methylated-DNA-[protein]-cysteine S-methyltransferase
VKRDKVRSPKIQQKRDTHVFQQLNEYFQGKRKEFTIPVDLRGTREFTRKALKTLHRQVRYGEKISYGALASKIGKPRAARAIGRAMRSNPIPIIIPCHRVVASNGSLGGYSAGLHRKRFLLSLENLTTA